MSWTTQGHEAQHAVQVRCTGKLSADDLTMLTMEASYLVRERGYTKILIDLSAAELGMSASQLSALLDIYAEHSLPLATRTAIVPGAGHSAPDLSKLLETAKQYGYQVDVLTSEQAERWLTT